jgi:hypothetical protein
MGYVRKRSGNYGGLASIWGYGPLPKITIPVTGGGSFIIPGRADPYYGFPYGRPYVGQRPPPPLFSVTEWGKAESMFDPTFENILRPEMEPRPRFKVASPVVFV